MLEWLGYTWGVQRTDNEYFRYSGRRWVVGELGPYRAATRGVFVIVEALGGLRTL